MKPCESDHRRNWKNSNGRSKFIQIFYPTLLTCKKLRDILFLVKKRNYLKANLLKSRDAKPEGAKVRKIDQVSRLPLFPYYIWKRCEKGRHFDKLYTIWICDFKEMQQGHWQFWQVSFLYAKMGNKTSRDRFSVYR